MERKYGALRVIATTMKILGILVGILTILSVCGLVGAGFTIGAEIERGVRAFNQSQGGGLGAITGLAGGLLASFLPIILGGSTALILFAGGEAIYVQIDIEHNTRSMAWGLHQRAVQPVSSYPAIQQPQPITDIPKPIPDQTSNMKYFCPQCGTKINPSDQVCPQCNYELS